MRWIAVAMARASALAVAVLARGRIEKRTSEDDVLAIPNTSQSERRGQSSVLVPTYLTVQCTFFAVRAGRCLYLTGLVLASTRR